MAKSEANCLCCIDIPNKMNTMRVEITAADLLATVGGGLEIDMTNVLGLSSLNGHEEDRFPSSKAPAFPVEDSHRVTTNLFSDLFPVYISTDGIPESAKKTYRRKRHAKRAPSCEQLSLDLDECNDSDDSNEEEPEQEAEWNYGSARKRKKEFVPAALPDGTPVPTLSEILDAPGTIPTTLDDAAMKEVERMAKFALKKKPIHADKNEIYQRAYLAYYSVEKRFHELGKPVGLENIEFKNHVRKAVKNAMHDLLQVATTPMSVTKYYIKYHGLAVRLHNQGLDDAEIAKEIGITERSVREILNASQPETSFSEVFDDDDPTTFSETSAATNAVRSTLADRWDENKNDEMTTSDILDAFYKAVGDLNDDDRLTVMTVLKDIEENGRIQRETLNSLAEKHGWGFKQMRDHLYNDVFPEIAENLPASIAKAFKPAE